MFSLNVYTVTSPAILRGGLIYADALTNQAIYAKHNVLPITIKLDSGRLITDLDKLYSKHCNRIAIYLENATHPLDKSSRGIKSL